MYDWCAEYFKDWLSTVHAIQTQSLTPSSDTHSSLSALRLCRPFTTANKLWRVRVTHSSSNEINLWQVTRESAKGSRGSGRWCEDKLRELQHAVDMHMQEWRPVVKWNSIHGHPHMHSYVAMCQQCTATLPPNTLALLLPPRFHTSSA